MIDVESRLTAYEFRLNTCRYNWRRFPYRERPDAETLAFCRRQREQFARERRKHRPPTAVLMQTAIV